MSTLPVLVHPPGKEEPVPGLLSTEHSASSYGRPVLVMEGVAYGPGDHSPLGAVLSLVLSAAPGGEAVEDTLEPGEEPAPDLLEAWEALTAAALERGPVAILKRLPTYTSEGESFFRIGGEEVPAGEEEDVEILLGCVAGPRAWWDLPLPACPDCGGTLAWAEAGSVPGARGCQECGSLFVVETRETRAGP